jgi:hypothetical protein
MTTGTYLKWDIGKIIDSKPETKAREAALLRGNDQREWQNHFYNHSRRSLERVRGSQRPEEIDGF